MSRAAINSQPMGSGLVTGVDARVKICVLAASLALVLSHGGVGFPLLVAIASILVCYLEGVPVSEVARRLREPGLVIAVLVLLSSLRGQEPAGGFGVMGHQVNFYRDGISAGLLLAMRLIAAVALVTLVSVTTSYIEFFGGLGWFRVPRTFIDVLMFAVRYIDLLAREAGVIFNAQKNRLGYSSIGRSFQSFGVLAGSLVVKAFDHAEATAVALRQRGFEGRLPEMEHTPLKVREVVSAATLLMAMVILWKLPLA